MNKIHPFLPIPTHCPPHFPSTDLQIDTQTPCKANRPSTMYGYRLLFFMTINVYLITHRVSLLCLLTLFVQYKSFFSFLNYLQQFGDGKTFIRVKKVLVHPNYGLESKNSADIALLELEVQPKLSSNINLACLPKRDAIKKDLQLSKLLIR